MDFLTTQNDNYAKRVCRDFPNVNLILISDPDVIEKTMRSQNLYIDERVKLGQIPGVALVLELDNTNYKIIHDDKSGYSFYTS